MKFLTYIRHFIFNLIIIQKSRYSNKYRAWQYYLQSKISNILKQIIVINFNLEIYSIYLTTIQLPSRFDPILSIIFFSCKDLNVLSIVLLVTPIFSASLIDIRLGFSIKSSITFFSVLFKPTFKPSFLLSIWSITSC